LRRGIGWCRSTIYADDPTPKLQLRMKGGEKHSNIRPLLENCCFDTKCNDPLARRIADVRSKFHGSIFHGKEAKERKSRQETEFSIYYSFHNDYSRHLKIPRRPSLASKIQPTHVVRDTLSGTYAPLVTQHRGHCLLRQIRFLFSGA
jgi:hypothetical protein